MNSKKKKVKPELTFKEVYKLPLKRYYSKVMTEDYHMAFDFAFQGAYSNAFEISKEQQDDIISLINGERKGRLDQKLWYNEKDGAIFINTQPFIVIRGWGYLTGTGALSLPQEKAIKIQNDFAEYIIKTLNPIPNNLKT